MVSTLPRLIGKALFIFGTLAQEGHTLFIKSKKMKMELFGVLPSHLKNIFLLVAMKTGTSRSATPYKEIFEQIMQYIIVLFLFSLGPLTLEPLFRLAVKGCIYGTQAQDKTTGIV